VPVLRQEQSHARQPILQPYERAGIGLLHSLRHLFLNMLFNKPRHIEILFFAVFLEFAEQMIVYSQIDTLP
jgi:hypothetical protein